jgi:hypothetical protein
MALEINDTYIDALGTEQNLLGAYARIEYVASNKENAVAHVFFYGSEGAAKANRPNYKSQQYAFTPTMTASNFIAQGYDYLKTLPEFADAVDC